METLGGEPDQAVSCRRVRAVDEILAGDVTDDRSDQVEFAGGIHAGISAVSPPIKSAPGLAARLHEADDQPLDDIRIDTRRTDVVEEEEGTRPVDEDVIDAVGDEIVADPFPAICDGAQAGASFRRRPCC